MLDTQTFTYADLARRLGITEGSCRNLVRRRRWAKTLGNDGQARISVPVEALPLHIDAATEASIDGDTSAATAATQAMQSSAALNQLQDEVASLRSALAKAEALANERCVTIERERARADEAQAEMRKVLERLLSLQERQAAPWWRRFLTE